MDSQELESTSELLILKTRDFHHHAINNIASQILKRSKNSLVDDHINISITLSRGRGDSCLALIRNIANEVSDDSFDISRRSPIFLAKLISILRLHEDDKYIEEAMNKIAASFRYSNAEQLLSTPTDTLKVILGGFCRHYKLKPVRRVIFDICAIVLDESTDLSDWPIETMDVLLRTLRSPYDDDIIQRAFRKIVAKLHCYDTELQKWSVQTIARVTKGVSHLRDYSSEEFVAQLAKIYMEKRDDDESTYGIMILSAICHLPIESSKIIKTAVKLASVLSNNAYSNMHKKGKLSLFWGITLLDFVVHDKWKKASSHLKTKDRIIKLTKTIPEIDQDTINQHPIFPAAWQLEFINITYFYRPHQLSHPKLLKGDNKAESDLEGNIYDLIKSSIPSLRINTNCRISQFPVDLLLSSRSMSTCLLVEADGPMHYFKGRSDKLHMLAKDRFMESVIQEKLSLKVIRINYHDAYKSKYRKQFIKKILAIFPNYTP
ncbi:MAG: hypothetical protein QS748_06260 [Candidatus Endonucleobacter bathymodioli]|uniref:RAP domain-containing protein n=1 Tax=Candidatus Endonucleibacter bathymodioli TaxID=539814 RepID=A0AA90P0P2_9GAMM|nr:hypothetical protein [Candidatus Endonucleobacter bathymodioli]